MDFNGFSMFYWFILDFNGFLSGFPGFYWVLLGFNEFEWFVMGCNGF